MRAMRKNTALAAVIGPRLRAAREELGLSQERAAHLAGVSLGSWNNWELGHNAPLQNHLRQAARVLRTTTEALTAPAE